MLSQNGQVTITPAANNSGNDEFAGYQTGASFDLTGSQVSIEAPEMVNAAVGAQAFLDVQQDGSNKLQIAQENGVLYFRTYVGSTNYTTLASVTYSSTTHRGWRIRETGGTVYFDTSDGASWTNRATAATPGFATAVRLEFGAGTYQSVASPGQAQFDNFNLAAP